MTKTREEAAAIRTRAEKEKTQAEAMQKEVSKNMKFLQRQALETLEKEERLRDREEMITEMENALRSRDETLQNKERTIDVEYGQLAAKAERAQAEVVKLKERLAEVEKSGPSMVEMEDWRRDIENRVKIVQKKAVDILDREEKLRRKENDLRSLAEKLGVRVDDVLTTYD